MGGIGGLGEEERETLLGIGKYMRILGTAEEDVPGKTWAQDWITEVDWFAVDVGDEGSVRGRWAVEVLSADILFSVKVSVCI